MLLSIGFLPVPIAQWRDTVAKSIPAMAWGAKSIRP